MGFTICPLMFSIGPLTAEARTFVWIIDNLESLILISNVGIFKIENQRLVPQLKLFLQNVCVLALFLVKKISFNIFKVYFNLLLLQCLGFFTSFFTIIYT